MKTPVKSNIAPFDPFATTAPGVFDPFAPAAVAPVAQTPPGGLDIFSPTSREQRAIDLFDQPVDVFALNAPTQPTQQPTRPFTAPIQDDPFAIGFDDDIELCDAFAPSHTAHTQGVDLLGESLHGAAHDPMQQLRLVYDLRGENDNESDMDAEDEVDNYDSKYFQKRSAPNPPPIATNRAPPAGPGTDTAANKNVLALTAGVPPNELWDGQILSRMSTKSLVTKDWHDTYYVIKGSTLFLYKNKLDFQKGTQNFKKKIPITHNLRVLQIKAKEYKGLGPVYNFMLEEIQDYGPSNVGKFGSTYRPIIEELWKRLRQLILKKREERAQGAQRYG